MHRNFLIRTKRIISAFLSIVMLLGILTAMPLTVYAEAQTTFTHDGYRVDYRIDSSWDDHQNISVTITNTGAETIEN